MQAFPQKQIRAHYDARTLRVYQAYSDAIADQCAYCGTYEVGISPCFEL